MVITENAFFCYFDIIGIQKSLADGLAGTIERIRGWQDRVRALADIHVPGSTIVTTADNIFARVHPEEADQVVHIAETAANALGRFGFDSYFGAITFGQYTADPTAVHIWTGSQSTDIRKQHVEFLSEPWLRCAVAEKVSEKNRGLPHSGKCVWLSEEAEQQLQWVPPAVATRFDLANVPGVVWPYSPSKFIALPFDTDE